MIREGNCINACTLFPLVLRSKKRRDNAIKVD